MLISFGYDNKLIIWNLSEYSIIKEINDIKYLFINGIIELPKNRLIIGEENNLILINYLYGKIIIKFEIGTKTCCFEIFNDSLLIADGNCLTINLKDFLIKKIGRETNYISCKKKLDSKIFAFGLQNGIMKIYKLLTEN